MHCRVVCMSAHDKQRRRALCNEALLPQSKDMRSEAPLFPDPEHGEIVTSGFVKHGLYWLSRFHDDKTGDSSRPRKFLRERCLRFSFYLRL